MLSKHLGLALTEQQRATWARRMSEAADEAGLPDDPEFRSAFVGYLEFGSRRAMANSQPDAEPTRRTTIKKWGWGEAPPGTD
jgi:hemoglobin